MFDLGDPIYIYSFCGAYNWFDERSGKNKIKMDLKFSNCCMKGKIVLSLLKKPHDLLYNLLHGSDHRCDHFSENIRAYNSMFSFTSIGGRVVSSINIGYGPSQFVLSGQNYHWI